MTELGPGWDHVFQATPSELNVTAKQKSLIDLAKNGKATTGVKIMAGPAPSMLEYALTKEAKAPAGADAASSPWRSATTPC